MGAVFNTAQHQVLYGIEANGAQSQGVTDCTEDLQELEGLHEPEELYVLPLT